MITSIPINSPISSDLSRGPQGKLSENNMTTLGEQRQRDTARRKALEAAQLADREENRLRAQEQRDNQLKIQRDMERGNNRPAPAGFDPVKRDLEILRKQVADMQKTATEKDKELKDMKDQFNLLSNDFEHTDRMLTQAEGTGYITPRRTGKDRLSISWDCPLPFDWFWSGAKTVTIKAGTARAHYNNYNDGILHSTSDDSPETAIILPDSAVARTEVVYAQAEYYFASTLALTILNAELSVMPEDSKADKEVSTPAYYRFPLYEFSTLGDGSTGANARYVCSKVRHFGDIDIWPQLPLWVWNGYVLNPLFGGFYSGTFDKAVDNTIVFDGGIARSKT